MKKTMGGALLLVLTTMMVCQLAGAGPETEVATTTVSITNTAPTVGTVTPTSPVVLSEHTTAVVTCSATVTDVNGYEDVTGATGKFYLTTAGAGCGASAASCYSNASCALSGGSGTTVPVTCSYTVSWYAEASSDNGTWTCNITATDSAPNTASNSSTTTVSDLIALDITPAIDFGSMIIGQTSAADQTNAVNNTGNVQIDINVNGTNMSCSTLGSIAVTYIHYNATGGSSYATMPGLTTDPADTNAIFKTNFNLAEGSSSTKDTYWKIQIPTGVLGSCNGFVQFEAIKG